MTSPTSWLLMCFDSVCKLAHSACSQWTDSWSRQYYALGRPFVRTYISLLWCGGNVSCDEDWDAGSCKSHFASILFHPRDKFNAVEGLCIVMRRLAFPCRWFDLVPVFGRSNESLSRIFKATMLLLMQMHGHLLDFNPAHFTHRLSKWARKDRAQGRWCESGNCFAHRLHCQS